jgi:hypothetical protein
MAARCGIGSHAIAGQARDCRRIAAAAPMARRAHCPDIVKINSPADGRSPVKIMKMMSYARIAILLATVAAVPAHAAAAGDDRYVRNVTAIADDHGFRAHDTRWRRQFPGFDWRTDGCSGPARLRANADHLDWPCVQHDFGDRNNRRVHRHDAAPRALVDAELLVHTRPRCAHDAVPAEAGCDLAAGNFDTAVRASGGSAL